MKTGMKKSSKTKFDKPEKNTYITVDTKNGYEEKS